MCQAAFCCKELTPDFAPECAWEVGDSGIRPGHAPLLHITQRVSWSRGKSDESVLFVGLSSWFSTPPGSSGPEGTQTPRTAQGWRAQQEAQKYLFQCTKPFPISFSTLATTETIAEAAGQLSQAKPKTQLALGLGCSSRKIR